MSAFLWILDLNYSSHRFHGGLLRCTNLSRELLSQGHSVTWAVSITEPENRTASLEWLESLRLERVISGFAEVTIDPALPRWNAAANWLLPFGLHRLALRPFVARVQKTIADAVSACSADTVIVANGSWMFTAYWFHAIPVIGDFVDSLTLYRWREFRQTIRAGRVKESLAALHGCLFFLLQERHSSAGYTVNVLVSPVDKRMFDRIGSSRKNALIANGIKLPEPAGAAKKPNRLIFSGVMNFPPNVDAALWFLDHVFPRILRERSDSVFVIAGATPHPRLRERESPNVVLTGFVEDLNQAIAESALYVAPMVSGSGFKNKIVEAIANHTYVVGTSYAVEFLNPDVRDLITVCDDPAEMARAICQALADPGLYRSKLAQLIDIVQTRFTWSARARELAELAASHRSTL